MQLLNELVHTRFPGKVMIAEDLKGEPFINRGVMGFDSQWDPAYFSAVKSMAVLTAVDPGRIDTGALCRSLMWGAFACVLPLLVRWPVGFRDSMWLHLCCVYARRWWPC